MIYTFSLVMFRSKEQELYYICIVIFYGLFKKIHLFKEIKFIYF